MRKRDAEKLKERRTDINFEIIYSLYFMITSDGTYMCKCFIIVYIEWGDSLENKIQFKWSM